MTESGDTYHPSIYITRIVEKTYSMLPLDEFTAIPSGVTRKVCGDLARGVESMSLGSDEVSVIVIAWRSSSLTHSLNLNSSAFAYVMESGLKYRI